MKDDGRLLWQCRRGIKEVEVVLVPFLKRHYSGLSEEKKQVFEQVLACADADLFEWVTERSEPEEPELRDMIREILQALAGDAKPYQE